MLFMYHISCNYQGIKDHGLIPYQYTSFNENPGPIYLAPREPSIYINDMVNISDDYSTSILDDYMLSSSYNWPTCPYFYLFKVRIDFLDPLLYAFTDDPREFLYKGAIPKSEIKCIGRYKAKRIEQRYNQLNGF